jgi:hydroxyethylthiazole kinase-like uncharacterized protein yjeF
MQRAGHAAAQLALAIQPHARHIWIACGPGNNGGDGLEAAVHLHQWGKRVTVTWLGQHTTLPADAQQSHQRAIDAGVHFQNDPPADFDLAIDALLGIGCQRAPEGVMANCLEAIHQAAAPILSLDVPSGLMADTGQWLRMDKNKPTSARHTLSLLTLKPGLFTADGRDATGEVWFDHLGIEAVPSIAPTAWLQATHAQSHARAHSSHKGSYGDVMVVGGAPGMSGAAVLASLAALHGGAGRVFLALLDTGSHSAVGATHPSLMVRHVESLDFQSATVVCGCGGADAVRAALPRVISTAARLVLDADALNAIAQDMSLQRLLKQRSARGQATVLTPHPLEAARLLSCTTAEVQNDRLQAAQQLAEKTQSVVVLKGSGSIVAHPAQVPTINPTGNALLATAGTGDVLAGLIGAKMAQGMFSFEAACCAVREHGSVADTWSSAGPALDSALLAASLR